MPHLSIDIETFSDVDLKKAGMYKYVQSPGFEVLLFAYAFDDDPVTGVDLTESSLPDNVLQALTDPTIKKTAWNAAFERVCLSKFFGLSLDPAQWECTMVKASMLGLPQSLDLCAKVLKLETGKLDTGKALIRYFCQPCKPTKTNGQRTRNYSADAPEKWQDFIEYNRQDVVVEREIRQRMAFFKIPEKESRLYALDQRINDRGVLLGMPFINACIAMYDQHRQQLTAEAIQITGLDNPNSIQQLTGWLSKEMPLDEIAGLRKTDIPVLKDAAAGYVNEETITRVLTIRQLMAKSSVKKYDTMVRVAGADNRARGMLQFGGAGRTQRWAGRFIQPQNLPRISDDMAESLHIARELVADGDMENVEFMFGSVSDTLSQLIRTALVAAPGHKLIPSDFSAIEARVIAWLAGEQWRLDVFNTHGKIYEASASQMFKVPIEKIKKGNPEYALRQRGKVAELALGYQGGVNALITMGALDMGIPEDELQDLVSSWRAANPAIVRYWKAVQNAALSAVLGTPVRIRHGITFFVRNDTLFIKLPSGRMMSYCRPRLTEGEYGDQLVYEGMDQVKKQWRRIPTYGGKLVENIVQAVARDCLAEAMLRLDDEGFAIVFHVHDEVVLEVPEDGATAADVDRLMCVVPDWATGLPLKADSYETKYYKKD